MGNDMICSNLIYVEGHLVTWFYIMEDLMNEMCSIGSLQMALNDPWPQVWLYVLL